MDPAAGNLTPLICSWKNRMPPWLMPAIKAILPHVGTIISATSPAFTRKKADGTRDQAALLQEQIEELQIAASTHDGSIKELAREIRQTVELLEASTASSDRRYRQMVIVSLGALALAIAALICALYALTVA